MTADEVKTSLKSYGLECEKLELLRNRLEELDARSTSIQTPDLNWSPSGNLPKDRVGGLATKIIDVMDEIEKQEDKTEELYEATKRMIERLPEKTKIEAQQRMILILRYLDGLIWDDVSRVMFSSRPDYNDETRRETYRRRTTKLHGEALQTLARILTEDEN